MKIVLTIILLFFTYFNIYSQTNGKYVIVIHGGAGYTSPDLDVVTKGLFEASLEKAIFIGKTILEEGGSSLDAVEQVIRFLEDDTLFNAGKGAVFTSEGTHELDASIMYGKDLSCGAVAGVTRIKNPISLSRLVMEQTPHVLFVGEKADNLGINFNVDIVDNSYFNTKLRKEKWLKKKNEQKSKGTVGCVALDVHGDISAATSTGGMSDKMPGRVGDAPLINAGTYANNMTCGVSATGHGELFIRNTVAFNISALMEYKNYSLQQACDEMIFNRLPEEAGGVIAIDKDGNFHFAFSTQSMFRAVADSEGIKEILIWK